MATLVIVPGSFCPAKNYKSQIESLAKQGVQAIAVDLPSIGRRPEGAATMTDDAEAIAKVVEPLLDQGKEVVLFTHSYGGIPGTQSLKAISKKSREAQGKTGGVDTVIYLTSIILQPGVNNYDLNKEQLEQVVQINVRIAPIAFQRQHCPLVNMLLAGQLHVAGPKHHCHVHLWRPSPRGWTRMGPKHGCPLRTQFQGAVDLPWLLRRQCSLHSVRKGRRYPSGRAGWHD